ncbi:hypothetical protein T08_15716 [Trichinella sp. T8]|nr:hypothetical protein T08_15716 [Trichinella sp. T8]
MAVVGDDDDLVCCGQKNARNWNWSHHLDAAFKAAGAVNPAQRNLVKLFTRTMTSLGQWRTCLLVGVGMMSVSFDKKEANGKCAKSEEMVDLNYTHRHRHRRRHNNNNNDDDDDDELCRMWMIHNTTGQRYGDGVVQLVFALQWSIQTGRTRTRLKLGARHTVLSVCSPAPDWHVTD